MDKWPRKRKTDTGGRKSKGEVVEIPFVSDTKRHSQETEEEEEIKIEM